MNYNTILTIAGSDSGGGAGVQADIKTISANGGYAATVITASTAQNTQTVLDVYPLPLLHIEAQLDALLSDIEFNAVKIGMLYSLEILELVEQKLEEYGVTKIVLDPVMLSTSGKQLLTQEAIDRLKLFIPKLYLLTPNIPEAEILLDKKISKSNLEESARELAQKYRVSVLLKGGHLENSNTLIDTLCIKDTLKIIKIEHQAIDTKNTHGTGCTLSSAIATYIGFGYSLEESVKKGCSYLHKAIVSGKDKLLGKGRGGVNHFCIV